MKVEWQAAEKCPLCESEEHEYLYTHISDHRPDNRWVLCVECGLAYTDPVPTQEWLDNFYKNDYRKVIHKSGEVHPLVINDETYRAGRQARTIKRYRDSVEAHLDIGSSTGSCLAAMQDMFGCDGAGVEPLDTFREWAIDRSREMIEVAEKRGYEDGKVATFYPSLEDIPNKKFDLVTVSHTLEHVRDPVVFLKNIRQYMTDDATLYVEVPNLYGTPAKEQTFVFPHLTGYTIHTAPLMVQAGEYSLVDVEMYGGEEPIFVTPGFIGVIATPAEFHLNKGYILKRVRRHDTLLRETIRRLKEAKEKNISVG